MTAEKLEVSFYDPTTGALAGRTFVGPARLLAANTPTGLRAVAGIHDHQSSRVNLNTRKVEDWQPPQPSDEHEWNAERKRWVLTAEAAQRQERDQRARARIRELEVSQMRAMREATLGKDAAKARERLAEIDAEIEMLRADIIT